MSKELRFSIIIPTYNSINVLPKCLESILECTKDFELIIVEDGSTDGTAQYLKNMQKTTEMIVIYNPEHTNFAKINNQGIKHVKGKYVVFLNSDTVVTKDWLNKIEKHFDNTPLRNVGMIGPVTNMSNGRQNVGYQDPEEWFEKNKNKWGHAGILYGWCMIIKKSVLDEVGGFDERFDNAYEDNDLCLRVQLAGYKLIIAYDTFIHHLGQGSLRQIYSTEQYKVNGEINRQKYFDKWYEPGKKKLVAVYRTNGGKYLEESLAQTSKFADTIIIHFCRATKNFEYKDFGDMAIQALRNPTTTDYIVYQSIAGPYIFRFLNRNEYINRLKIKFPKIKKVEFYDGIFQEDYERNWLLQEALKLNAQGLADWCISVDDDEIYEDKFIEHVQKMMTPRNPEVFGYWCQWRTIWDKRLGKEYYRADGIFGNFINYRFFKLIQKQEIYSEYHPEGHHAGSAPLLAPENLRFAKIRVKHLGYDTPEQRQKKFDFYEDADHFKRKEDIGNDDYSHLINVNVQLERYRENNGITLLMMVRDEEEWIQDCLEHIASVIDEYIIVDTGSKDKTLKLIKDFAKYSTVPVKVYHHPWCDNYSIPRNYGKQFVTQRWILCLDADERFEYEKLRVLFNMTETEADVIKFHVVNYLEKAIVGKKPKYASTESVRLYRNIPELYYAGIIHETLDDSIGALKFKRKVKIMTSPFVLHHYGYLRKKENRVNQKLEYYEKLNQKQIEITDNSDARPHFNLALHWLNDGDQKRALQSFHESLKINPNFWHSYQQMAALNIKSAKIFLKDTLTTMPKGHPFRKEGETILKYLNEHSFGHVKVT